MNTTVDRLRRIVDSLQEIIDLADDEGVTNIKTTCNTYGLSRFICLGSDGYLDLDEDASTLLIEDEDEDEDEK